MRPLTRQQKKGNINLSFTLNTEYYHWHASLNYAGKKMFSVIKNENREIIEFLLKEIEK